MPGEQGACASDVEVRTSVPFRLGVLGQLTIWTGAGTAVRLALRPRLVLAALAVAEPAVVSTEQIGDLIWGERRPATWIAQVHNVIRGLRKSLAVAGAAAPADVVRTDGAGYRLDLPPDALDVNVFRRLVARAESSAGSARLDLLRAAEACWRGPALADLRATGLAAAAHGLDDERLTATQVRLELELELAGRTAYVVAEAGRLLAEHPWLERVHGLLMTGLWRQGRSVEAADHYRRLRARLSAELGIEPAAYLRTLHSRILANDLADSGRPAAPRTPHQLPAVPADVVGRDEQVAGIVAAATRRADRLALVALHGPPGIGKTTTALLVAGRLAGRYRGGELFLRMRDAEGRPQPTAGLLGGLIVGLDPAVPVPADPVAGEGLWRTMTAGRRVVVVLDDAQDEAAVRPLLPAPGNAVVVTSIPALPGLESAVQRAVPALPAGVARAWLTAAAGVGDHAGALDRVVETCAGSPLALRIVAARLATHAHESLDTAASALGSPDTALDWLVAGDLAVAKSLRYAARDLDSEVLRGLGMLAGCGLLRPAPWLVAALLGVGERQGRAVLERLADVGLLTPEHPGAGGFGMHGLVQELARRMAAPAGSVGWRRLGAHAARLARRAQRRTAQLEVTRAAGDPSEACADIDQDPMAWLDLNWPALEVIGRQPAVGSADRAEIALATAEYCACRGQHAQSQELIDEVIPSVTDPKVVLALYNMGFGARVRSGTGGDDLLRWNERWRGVVERYGSAEDLVAVRLRQGFAAQRAGDLSAALRHYQAALAGSVDAGPRLRASALSGLGSVLSDLGDVAAAYDHFSSAVEVSRDMPARFRAIILGGQAEAAIMLGDAVAATHALAQSRSQLTGLGDLPGEAHLDALEGWIRALRGDQGGAAIMLNRARQHIDSEPDRQERAWLRLIESDVARRAGDPERAEQLVETVAHLARRDGDRLSEIRAELWQSDAVTLHRFPDAVL